MSELCGFDTCRDANHETQMVSVDHFGHHWFCNKHWAFVEFFFNNMVIPCCRNDNGCIKNHAAEYYKSEFIYKTVKHDGRYYDVCAEHLNIYDQLLGIMTLDDYED